LTAGVQALAGWFHGYPGSHGVSYGVASGYARAHHGGDDRFRRRSGHRMCWLLGEASAFAAARESDDPLCFSAAALRSDPARAPVAVVRVGEAPVGLMLVRDGSRVVADSNRFNATGANSDLSVPTIP
jgi:hypothetical protein